MGTSNEELLSSILYYQQSLQKYASLNNPYKLIGIIHKLKKLPIATFHLEETGIGRTVNALRKLGGEVSEAAKSLVIRWKEMVMQEEQRAKLINPNSETAYEPYVPENDNDYHKEEKNSCKVEDSYKEEQISCKEEPIEESSYKDEDIQQITCKEEEDRQYLEKQSSSSHISSDTVRQLSESYKKGKEIYSLGDIGSGTSYEEKSKHQNKNSSDKKRRKSDSSNEEHISKKHLDSSGFDSEEGIHEGKQTISKLKRNIEYESSENEEVKDRKHKSKKSRHSKDSSDSEDSYKKHKSSKSSRESSSSKSKSKEKTEKKKRGYDSSSDREVDKSKSKHKSKRESDCEEDKSSSKHKNKKRCESSSDNEEAKHKSKHDSKSRHDKDSSRSKESKSHSSRSDKHEKKDKKESKRDESKESKRDESKEKHSHRKGESRTHEEKHKKSDEKEKESSKKQKSSSSSRQEESSKPSSSSSSSKHKSSSEKKKDKIKLPKPVNTEKIMNGIDSGSGASFAEALGMCGPMVSKNTSSSKKKSSSLPSYEKPRSSSSYVRPEKTEIEEDAVPTLLKEQPHEPINLNISSLLPDITPNYRPVGFPIDSQPKRILSQDEALSQVISNKNMRTKVYSGNKSFGKVETLFDLCVRILQDNIDALEYTGGVPYLILKPVLERATPDQLFNMEHHNPYLIEDTNELWQLHCQKEFRNKKREELESWREMYMRCLNEREARLNAITANIKQSQDKSTPLRTTKFAYIDSVVKPPRNIARKQAKNGIADKKPAQTPASRVAALASHVDTGKVAVPNPGHRAADRPSSTAAAMKPKKAPLMAKTLSFLKNRFRR